jgi:hypothetical protein
VRLRALLAFALVSLLVAGGAAPPAPELEQASARAERDWSHAIGTLGYVHGAPLLETAIAEYRQTQALAPDLSAKRGLLAHLMGGALPTHETTSFGAPEPDVLLSSAWLDVAQQPFVLFVPPMDGHWYSIQLVDAFGAVAGALSSRTMGSVGGWHLLAHAAWEGERPPGLMEDELRVATPVARLLLRIAATRKTQADLHARYQARFLLLPLDAWVRNPKAAEYVKPQPQPGRHPAIRATPEMRGTADAFRVINHQLRQLEARPAEAALLALLDRAGFGPAVLFDPLKLSTPRMDGLRSAARDAQRMLRDARTGAHGWSALPAPPGAAGGDALLRGAAALDGLAPTLPEEIAFATTNLDADGRSLDGRNDYVIRFAKDALPPARAFWSLAAYDAQSGRLFDTGAAAYSVGSLGEGLVTGARDEVEIFVSSDSPEDPARRANWLPVRSAPFLLVARLYEPLPAALDAGYSLPPVEAADN